MEALFRQAEFTVSYTIGMIQSTVIFGDNLDALKNIPSNSVNLIYIDPPFNTGKVQARKHLKTTRSKDGDRKGYKGEMYTTEVLGEKSYDDFFDDFLLFIKPRLIEAYRVLKNNGSLFFHIDYREAHYCKVLLDKVFGRDCFMNEIIWAYDYGARSRSKWSAKHDTIFWYAKDPKDYTYNYDAIDRIPYMAPGLVGKEKALKGKTPTDVWWNTIVSPNGHEKTGYPTQKPKAIIERIIRVHSDEGDAVLDFFAGSGTLGEVAYASSRPFILIDNNKQSIEVIKERFKNFQGIKFI